MKRALCHCTNAMISAKAKSLGARVSAAYAFPGAARQGRSRRAVRNRHFPRARLPGHTPAAGLAGPVARPERPWRARLAAHRVIFLQNFITHRLDHVIVVRQAGGTMGSRETAHFSCSIRCPRHRHCAWTGRAGSAADSLGASPCPETDREKPHEFVLIALHVLRTGKLVIGLARLTPRFFIEIAFPRPFGMRVGVRHHPVVLAARNIVPRLRRARRGGFFAALFGLCFAILFS